MEEERENQKRQVAQKARIRDILEGIFVQEEGWRPNYVELDDGRKVSRVNIIGIVVSKEDGGSFNSLLIDDGNDRISARVFADDVGKLANIDIGDVVLIIGRPREYSGEKYLLIEIAKKVEDKKWLEVRKAELGVDDDKVNNEVNEGREESVKTQEVVEEVSAEEPAGQELSLTDKIIEFIKKKDEGEGVDIEEVIKEFDEVEVKKLLSEGELFEIRPGRVKVLE